jgi:signal peptidase I
MKSKRKSVKPKKRPLKFNKKRNKQFNQIRLVFFLVIYGWAIFQLFTPIVINKPTIHVNIINRLTYLFSMPPRTTWIAVKTHHQILTGRVIGLPGDHLSIEGNFLLINRKIKIPLPVNFPHYHISLTIPHGYFFYLPNTSALSPFHSFHSYELPRIDVMGSIFYQTYF